METLRQDLRHGLRMLAKHPGFTAVAVLTLALGIGANTALFSVVNAVLLRPLPFKEPERLLALGETKPRVFSGPVGVSFPNFSDWQGQHQIFEYLAAYRGRRLTLTGEGEPLRVTGQAVSPAFFPLLGVEAMLGRTFLPGEGAAGGPKVVVLSHSFWQHQFSGSPTVLGQTLTLDHNSYTVVGVMPPGFKFLQEAEVWTPLVVPAPLQRMRGAHFLQVIGRLKPGVTMEQARTGMETLARGLAQKYPESNFGWGVSLLPLQEQVVGQVRRGLWVIFGAVGMVLLIACTNVANLLLARAATRRREIAIRAALGAGRGRLIRHLLTESLLLGLLGGGLGLLVALWGIPLLLALSPGNVPRLDEVALDSTALYFTLAVSLLTSLVFGLSPAFRASKLNLSQMLKEGVAYRESGLSLFRHHRLRSLLVVSEIALALVLLVGAGLLARSFFRLMAAAPGFRADNLLTMQISLPQYKYPQEGQQANFFQQLLERAASLPGVRSVALTDALPLSGDDSKNSFGIEGRASTEAEWASLRAISPDYFRTMGIPLLAGRTFTAQDTGEAPRVVIINQAMARRFWPAEEPVGKRLRFGQGALTIIGVAGDVKHQGLGAESAPEMYLPFLQGARSVMILVARTDSDPLNLVAGVRTQVQALDKDQPVERIQTMADLISRSVAQPRFNSLLLSLFAALALSLAAGGVYGVISYSVSQRTHEIGVRLALGARPPDIFRLVLGQGLSLALLGVLIGLAAAFALTRVMVGLLYEVSATDPPTFALISLLLTVVALLASYLPALKAAKVDPLIALRHE